MSELKETVVECPACNGSGIEGYVTRDMATDACEPTMEGMPMKCPKCKGDGYIFEYCEVEPAREEGEDEN